MYSETSELLEEELSEEELSEERTLVKESMDDICEALEKEILKSDAAEEEKQAMLSRLRKLCSTETNIMLVGATGCGKSSTINALFSCNQEEEYVEVAKVGSRADYVADGINNGAVTGFCILGAPGALAGSVVGAFVGGIKGILNHIF